MGDRSRGQVLRPVGGAACRIRLLLPDIEPLAKSGVVQGRVSRRQWRRVAASLLALVTERADRHLQAETISGIAIGVLIIASGGYALWKRVKTARRSNNPARFKSVHEGDFTPRQLAGGGLLGSRLDARTFTAPPSADAALRQLRPRSL